MNRIFHQVAQHLISIGADLSLRCKWTDMSALHYAAYFDVGPVLTTLLRKTKVVKMHSSC